MFVGLHLVTIQADTVVASFGINTVRIAIAVVLNSTFGNIDTSVIRHGITRSTAALVASVYICALVIPADVVIALIDVQAVGARVRIKLVAIFASARKVAICVGADTMGTTWLTITALIDIDAVSHFPSVAVVA